jgi:probable phosphoglycerate mutase
MLCTAQRAAKALQRATQQAAQLTLLLVARHGETQWNVEHRLQGSAVPGPGLTHTGEQQAQVLAERLRARQQSGPAQQELVQRPITAIYTSDLARAMQTTDAVADALPGVPVHAWPLLRERALGVLQGLTREEARVTQPEAWAVLTGECETVCMGAGEQGSGVESIPSLQARAAAVALEIAERHAGQAVLLVSHGGFITALLMHAACAGGGASPPVAGVRNTSIHMLAVGRKRSAKLPHAPPEPTTVCSPANPQPDEAWDTADGVHTAHTGCDLVGDNSTQFTWVLLGEMMSSQDEGGGGEKQVGASLSGGGLQGG